MHLVIIEEIAAILFVVRGVLMGQVAGRHLVVDHAISKRYVLFPRYSVVQITGGLSVPAIFPRRSINLSLGFQMNHELPWSLANFEPLYGGRNDGQHQSLDIDRETLYTYLVNIIESLGMDGEACLLRAICDTAKTPLYSTPDGAADTSDYLLEQIVHYLMTPSVNNGINGEWQLAGNRSLGILHKAMVAEGLGTAYARCADIFACPLSLIDLFTNKYLT